MTIGRKLYLSFGAVLVMVVVLFAVNLAAVYREHSAKAAASQALQLADATDKIRFQMMQNRLYLTNYLLSGDSRESDHVNDGVHTLIDRMQSTLAIATSEQQRSALAKVQQTEQNWARDFAEPLMQKRKDVDQGNSTVAELQIFYLQKDASSWVKSSTEYLDLADQESKRVLEERRKSDEAASNWTIGIAFLGTLAALGLGSLIALRTAKSITEPLTDLMKVAKQIGTAGDLDHEIDIKREDEIGELARTFNGMVGYLREMASVSEAIAGGNLSVEVQPRSKNDTLGNAFVRMMEGLQKSGAQRARRRFAGGQRFQSGGGRLRRIGQDQPADLLRHRRSHQHHARDERQRAEHGEEHAECRLPASARLPPPSTRWWPPFSASRIPPKCCSISPTVRGRKCTAVSPPWRRRRTD